MIDLLGPGPSCTRQYIDQNSHLTFPCNLQPGKQQHRSGTSCCLGQQRKYREEECPPGLCWVCELILGGWYLQNSWDMWISWSFWKLLYENISLPLLMKKPPDFEGASSRAPAPCCLSSCFLQHLIASWEARPVTNHGSQPWDIFSSGAHVSGSHHTVPMIRITVVAD